MHQPNEEHTPLSYEGMTDSFDTKDVYFDYARE